MDEKAIEKLLEAISYPDRAGVEGARAVLTIDEDEVFVEVRDRFLRFMATLDIGDSELVEFAAYVPGRIYKDAATLAVGDDGRAFLWQDVPAASDERTLRQTFEAFLASCDWWRERIDAGRTDSEVRFQDVLIRP